MAKTLSKSTYLFLVSPVDYHLFYPNSNLNVPTIPINVNNVNHIPREPYQLDNNYGLLSKLLLSKFKIFHPLLYLKKKFKNVLFGHKIGLYKQQHQQQGIGIFTFFELLIS